MKGFCDCKTLAMFFSSPSFLPACLPPSLPSLSPSLPPSILPSHLPACLLDEVLTALRCSVEISVWREGLGVDTQQGLALSFNSE